MVVVLLGPPGSGKGTQAAQLAPVLKVPHVATGDILREEVSRESELGRKARSIMEEGGLVPDELVLAILRTRLSREDCAGGFLLDGYPRSLSQAETLDRLLAELDHRVNRVVNIVVPENVLVERMTRRSRTERRTDDRPDVFRERLRVYREKTRPVVEYYRSHGVLAEIDGTGSIEDVARAVREAVPVAEAR
jgi:adenylate kinase